MLSNKVIVITGGAGGIGAATAERLVAKGFAVLVVDRDLAAAEAVAKRLGQPSSACAADVSNEDDVKGYVAAAIERYGRIDAFFNNAGIEGKVMPRARSSAAASMLRTGYGSTSRASPRPGTGVTLITSSTAPGSALCACTRGGHSSSHDSVQTLNQPDTDLGTSPAWKTRTITTASIHHRKVVQLSQRSSSCRGKNSRSTAPLCKARCTSAAVVCTPSFSLMRV
mgnify:CR=1 FL=1